MRLEFRTSKKSDDVEAQIVDPGVAWKGMPSLQNG